MKIWLFLFVAIVLWYIWVTLRVGYKGAADIRQMIKNLKDQQDHD